MKRGWLILCFFQVLLVQAQQNLNVALIMPFCSKQIAADPRSENAELGKVCRSYFKGMKLAMDSFNTLGYKISLNVYDTQNDSVVMAKLIAKPAFRESELVIGPVLQGGNKMLTGFANEKKVYHVSPLMTFSKTRLNDEYWISSNPDLPSFADLVYEHLVSLNDTLNVVVVSDQSSLDKNFTPAFKKIAGQKKIKVKYVAYAPTLDINMYLQPAQHNVVIIPTATERIANGVLYAIKDTTILPRLTTIGFQQWFDFKNADLQLWSNKHVRFASTYFVDYADPAVIRFVEQYREVYSAEPDEAAFKGYDHALLYIGERYKNGNDFMKKLADKKYKACHTTFRFVRAKEGGAWQNNWLNFLELNEGKLQKVSN